MTFYKAISALWKTYYELERKEQQQTRERGLWVSGKYGIDGERKFYNLIPAKNQYSAMLFGTKNARECLRSIFQQEAFLRAGWIVYITM
eukprot:CFRG5087T1